MIQASEIPIVPIFFFQDYDPFFFFSGSHVLSQKASSLLFPMMLYGSKEKEKRKNKAVWRAIFMLFSFRLFSLL